MRARSRELRRTRQLAERERWGGAEPAPVDSPEWRAIRDQLLSAKPAAERPR